MSCIASHEPRFRRLIKNWVKRGIGCQRSQNMWIQHQFRSFRLFLHVNTSTFTTRVIVKTVSSVTIHLIDFQNFDFEIISLYYEVNMTPLAILLFLTPFGLKLNLDLMASGIWLFISVAPKKYGFDINMDPFQLINFICHSLTTPVIQADHECPCSSQYATVCHNPSRPRTSLFVSICYSMSQSK